jgi:hypothetical protein
MISKGLITVGYDAGQSKIRPQLSFFRSKTRYLYSQDKNNLITSKVMSAEELKERLHLRIEQADEKLLQVWADMTENLFEAYQSKLIDSTDTGNSESYKEHLLPLSREEMTEEIEKAMADYERGDYLTLKESIKEAKSW